MRRPRISDERGLVGISLIRWGILIVLLGLIAVEGGSVIFTKIGLQNAADAAALEAADLWRQTLSLPEAENAAREVLDEQGHEDAKILKDSFEAQRGEPFEVRFTVVERAATLLLHRVGFLEDLGRVTAEAEARPIQSGV